MRATLAWILVLIFASACSSTPDPDLQNEDANTINAQADGKSGEKLPVVKKSELIMESPPLPPAPANISEETAALRAKMVKNVRYELVISLDEKKSVYTGRVTIRFDRTRYRPSEPLRIDFANGLLDRVEINGQRFQSPPYNKVFIQVASKFLQAEGNELVIRYRHEYSKNGTGLYRFTDQVDQKTYVYTDFEPYHANHLFPCFDQPNIKAKFKLEAIVPKDWQVVTAATLDEIEELDSGRKQWIFNETKPISTYVFPLQAGPFHIWKSNAGNIPLRLMVRKSLAKYVDQDQWFTITRQGIDFFSKYFDRDYPFEKLDQVLVPDFNWGGMENVGAITYNERNIFRGKPTRRRLMGRANLILHEVAHMWFGNLVTMDWWNGLWLNESFATFMAHLALAEATEYKEAWKAFFSGTKQWAYWEDEMVTTHPIETPVKNTDEAFTNFDGVTYGKGASALKQIHFYIGPTKFRDGLRLYFKNHAFKNTKLVDFLAALEESSKFNLGRWNYQWLQTAGTNSIQVDWACQDGRINKFDLIQSAPKDHPELRVHRSQIGLYVVRSGRILTNKIVAATYEGGRTPLVKAIGLDCPDLVFPNHGDHGFFRVNLDQKTLQEVLGGINTIRNSLLRAQIWQTLWNMVRDGKFSAVEYADLALQSLPEEKDFIIAQSLLHKLHGRRQNSSSVLYYYPHHTEQERAQRDQFADRLEMFYWERLQQSQAGSDFQKLWFDSYVQVVQSDDGQKNLVDLLEDKKRLESFNIDQDRRWKMVWRLSSLGHKNARFFRQQEKTRDPSERGEKAALAAEVATPSIEAKRRWFLRLIKKNRRKTYRFAQLQTIMESLFPQNQSHFRASYQDEFFARLPGLMKSTDQQFIEEFTSHLVPRLCTPGSVERTQNEVQRIQASGVPIAIKNLKISQQEDAKCVQIRAKILESLAQKADSKPI